MHENASLIYIEWYRLSPKNQAKYEKWMDDYGFGVLIPLITKMPGVVAFDCYKDAGLRAKSRGTIPIREWEYPYHFSIVSFDNQKAFIDYSRSSELISCQKAVANIFPSGFNYKWCVQYELVKSWRK
jgi:hypothetical protein